MLVEGGTKLLTKISHEDGGREISALGFSYIRVVRNLHCHQYSSSSCSPSKLQPKLRMASHCLLTLFLLSLAMSMVVCQTFQYSHGWTNGKRSSLSWTPEDFIESLNKNALQTAVLNCQIQKLRLLLQGNTNDRFLQVPCDPQGSIKRSYTENLTNPVSMN